MANASETKTTERVVEAKEQAPKVVDLGKVTELTGRKGRQFRDGRKDSERQ